MTDDAVTVPPGHKIVVIHPVASPTFGRTGSGVFIVDLGAGADFESAVKAAERFIAAGQDGTILWLVQEGLLSQLADRAPLLSRLELAIRQSEGRIRHCAVLVLQAAQRQDLVQQLKTIGMSVHGSANDGACFVEAYRPDGTIVIGMPGPVL